jgi:predicted MPP superfamily phosphohydrolase
VRLFYIVAAFWLGLLLYLFLVAGLIWLGTRAAGLFSFSLNAKLLAQILFGLALLVSIYGAVNAAELRVTRLKINLPNLPDFWQGKTAVWVSDVHLGPVRDYNFSQEVAAQVQKLSPDIIFIGGDLFDGEDGDLDKLAEPFGKLSASQGVYFITGNHEEFTASSKYVDAVKRAGIRVLNNEMINLQGLQLIGVDYQETGNKQNYINILQHLGLDREKPSILLKHSSFWPQLAAAAGISLQLSGHSHHGQIFPVGLVSYFVFQGYEYGLKHVNNMTIYTSSGVGTWGPPMRVGTIPEIVQIQFNKGY